MAEIDAIFKYASADASEDMDIIYPQTMASNVLVKDNADSGELPVYTSLLGGTVLEALKTLSSEIKAIIKGYQNGDKSLDKKITDINSTITEIEGSISDINDELDNLDIEELMELIEEAKEIVNNFYLLEVRDEDSEEVVPKGGGTPKLWYEILNDDSSNS